MRRLSVLLAGVLAFSSATGAEKKVRTPAIEGAYIQPSSSFTHPAPGEVEEVAVSNLLCIRRLTAGKFEFYLKTWGNDASYCSGTGIATIESDKRGLFLHMAPSIKHSTSDALINRQLHAWLRGVEIEDHSEDNTFRCELKIRISRNSLSIEDTVGECNSRFMCGTNAGIYGSFPRKPRVAISNYGECFEN